MGFQPQRRRPFGLIILVTLVAVAGLLTGAGTRLLLTPRAPIGNQGGAQATQTAPTATLAPAITATATTNSATPPSTLAHFSTSLSISPKSGPVGSSITITAIATVDGTHAPMQGLTCTLRTPTDGSRALFTSWPSPTATNSNGVATWTATVPNVTPGTYFIEVYAQTPSWTHYQVASFTVVGS